jgi:hypothetical protein
MVEWLQTRFTSNGTFIHRYVERRSGKEWSATVSSERSKATVGTRTTGPRTMGHCRRNDRAVNAAGSLPGKSTQSVPYKNEPDRGSNGIQDDSYADARQCCDAEDARHNAHIGRKLTEYALQHYKPNNQKRE